MAYLHTFTFKIQPNVGRYTIYHTWITWDVYVHLYLKKITEVAKHGKPWGTVCFSVLPPLELVAFHERRHNPLASN